MPISTLSPLKQKFQIELFVDSFVKEFISEVWYLEESSRGNIKARKQADLSMLLRVATALISLVPIPGAAFAFIVSQHVISEVIKFASEMDNQGNNDWETQAKNFAKLAKQNWETYSGVADDITTLRGEGVVSSGINDDSALVDSEILKVVAIWLGYHLASRYEQVLTERISTNPEEAILGIARTAARRCFMYLIGTEGFQANHERNLDCLLAGVVLGHVPKWFERPLTWIHREERVKGRDIYIKHKFTAERVFQGGVWLFQNGEPYQLTNIEWISEETGLTALLKTQATQNLLPKYGYITTKQKTNELSFLPVKTGTHLPELKEWNQRRYFQTITFADIQSYVNSKDVLDAKRNNVICSKSLTVFLHETRNLPVSSQLCFTGDLRDLDLSSCFFEDIDLSGSILKGNLSNAVLKSCKLFYVRFENTFAKENVNFSFSKMCFCDLSRGQFHKTVFLTQTDLTGANLFSTSFGVLQHIGAVWYKANLQSVQYDAIQEIQSLQLKQLMEMADQQKVWKEGLELKLQKLEAFTTSMMNKIDSIQGQNAQEKKHRDDKVDEVMQAQKKLLLDQVLEQENRLKFEAYCQEKIKQFEDNVDSNNSEQKQELSNLKYEYTRVNDAIVQGHTAIEKQLDEIWHRLSIIDVDLKDLKQIQTKHSAELTLVMFNMQENRQQLDILRQMMENNIISSDNLNSPEEFLTFGAFRARFSHDYLTYECSFTEHPLTNERLAIKENFINLSIIERTSNFRRMTRSSEAQSNDERNAVLTVYENLSAEKASIDIAKVFQDLDRTGSLKINIVGRAGVGKSTFCRYVVNQWASQSLWNSEFDLIVWFPLRYFTTERYAASGANLERFSKEKTKSSQRILNFLVYEFFHLNKLSDVARNKLEKLLEDKTILWLLDGYDEVVQGRIPDYLQDFMQDLLNQRYRIITSRPYFISDVACDYQLEIVGFTKENMENYIHRNVSSKVKQSLLTWLQENSSVESIAHVPVNLSIICHVWEKLHDRVGHNTSNISSTMTLTILYQSVIQLFYQRYQHRAVNNNKKEGGTSDIVKLQKLIQFLAYQNMVKDRLLINERQLQEEITLFITNEGKENNLSPEVTVNEWKKELMHVGIVKTVSDFVSEDNREYYFLHLTFQEYLTANYLAEKFTDPLASQETQHELKSFIAKHKYKLRFEVVFSFTSGLLASFAKATNYSPITVLAINSFFVALTAPPHDLIGYFDAILFMRCLEEAFEALQHIERSSFMITWLDDCLQRVLSEESLLNTNKIMQVELRVRSLELLLGCLFQVKRLSNSISLSKIISKALHSSLPAMQKIGCELFLKCKIGMTPLLLSRLTLLLEQGELKALEVLVATKFFNFGHRRICANLYLRSSDCQDEIDRFSEQIGGSFEL
jgi:hypothetical protein